MPIQTPTDYFKIFSDLVQRCNELTGQRDEIDVEIAKVKQSIIVTFALIPEEKQRVFQTEIDEMTDESAGLLDAIKLVFSTHKGEWLTASKVYEYMVGNGFDFRHYRANPLASINTTLKRMVSNFLESMNSGSGILYKRRLTLGDRIAGYNDVPLPTDSISSQRSQIDPDKLPEEIRASIYGQSDLPAHHPSHPIHNAGSIAKVTEAKEWKPKYGTPNPLNRRGKK